VARAERAVQQRCSSSAGALRQTIANLRYQCKRSYTMNDAAADDGVLHPPRALDD
jgi:hypothetical protein